jgi:DNA-binding transcriptional LysR family regulator
MLQTKLFHYDGHTLHKTEACLLLERYAISMQYQFEELQLAIADKKRLNLRIGATKTIGEFVIVPEIREFLRNPKHNLQLTVDNTENLLRMVEKSQIDFAVIEGVFDKSKYGYHLYKKENFVGICSENHRFANRTVSLQEIFEEDLLVREPFSGTRTLFENAISDRGFSLESFKRCISVSNFSVICDLVANVGAITFAYEPISRHRKDLATFSVQDMQICGEFNFVYCNGSVAHQKIESIFSSLPQGQ